jgi:hypothetical protein
VLEGQALVAALQAVHSIMPVGAGDATTVQDFWFQEVLAAEAAVLEMEIRGHPKTDKRIQAEGAAESATPQALAVQGAVELLFWHINNTKAMTKKSILYFFALLSLIGFGFSNQANAQGSLQFNQALVLSSQNQANCNTCWTVPANTVWKITGFTSNSNDIASLVINGLECGYLWGQAFNNTSISYAYGRWHVPTFPYWLPAGSTLGFIGLGPNRNIIFNGIEFNIVP